MLQRGDERRREANAVHGEHGADACHNAARRLRVACTGYTRLTVGGCSRSGSDLLEMSGKRTHRVGRHQLERREKCPLVRVGLEALRIQEHRRVRPPPLALERQCDEIPECAPRKEVLRGKEAVIAGQIELCTRGHRFTQQVEPDPTRVRGKNRLGKEDPHVCAFA